MGKNGNKTIQQKGNRYFNYVSGPEAVGVVAEDLLHTPGGGVRLMREGGEGGAGHPGIRRETPPMTGMK